MRYIAFFSVFILLACSHANPKKHEAKNPSHVQFPLYPGCENYYTPEMQKWCFKKKFTDELARKLATNDWKADLLNSSTGDTIWLRIKIDTAGYFHADSLLSVLPEQTGNFLQKFDSIFHLFPPVDPALQKGLPVAVQFKVPIVRAKADNH